jgi:hypothetical protein
MRVIALPIVTSKDLGVGKEPPGGQNESVWVREIFWKFGNTPIPAIFGKRFSFDGQDRKGLEARPNLTISESPRVSLPASLFGVAGVYHHPGGCRITVLCQVGPTVSSRRGAPMNYVTRAIFLLSASLCLFAPALSQSHSSDGMQFGKTWLWLGMPEAQALTSLKRTCQVQQTGLGTYGLLPRKPDCFGFVVFKSSKLVFANRAATLGGQEPVEVILESIVQFTDTYHTETCKLFTSLGKGRDEFHAFVRCGQHAIHTIVAPTEKSISEELGEMPED